MKKILLIILALFVSVIISNLSFSADITVNDILNKMQENYSKIEDMKAEIITTTYMGTQIGTMTQKMNYYYKKPDKIKIETIEPVKQTIIIIGENMTMKTADGKVSTMNLRQMMSGMGMNQQYFGTDITGMLKNYNITLNETLTDRINNIYVLDLMPKENTPSSSPMGAYMPSKMEMHIDYTKGISIRQKIYGKDNTLMATTEVKDTRQIEGIWFPVVTQSTTFLPTGQQVKSDMRFENVQVNTGIGDGEFEVK